MKFLACICLLGLLVAANAAPAPTPETEPASAVRLRPTAQVDSRGIFLHQIIESPVPLAANLRLAPAPAPGQTLELTREQIAQAIQASDPAQVLTNWVGPLKIKIGRRLRQLEEAELRDLLTAALQQEKVKERGELELRLGRPWTAVPIPDEPFTVKLIELPTAGVTPNFILRFELRTERESIGIWQIPLQARLWRDVWVARNAQPRGRSLREADLTTERRDALTLRDAVTALDFNDLSLELTENLAPGAPLLTRSIRQRPVIQRGKLVDAIVQDGSLLITLKAEALEDGLPGQTIRVRNATSKREFRGKVQNEQTVVVAL